MGGKKGQFAKKEEDRKKKKTEREKERGVGGWEEGRERKNETKRERELEGVSKEGGGRKRNGKNCHAKWKAVSEPLREGPCFLLIRLYIVFSLTWRCV